MNIFYTCPHCEQRFVMSEPWPTKDFPFLCASCGNPSWVEPPDNGHQPELVPYDAGVAALRADPQQEEGR